MTAGEAAAPEELEDARLLATFFVLEATVLVTVKIPSSTVTVF